MIKSFPDTRTQELFLTGAARRFPAHLAGGAARKLEYVNLATSLTDLSVPPGNRLHALKGDRKGQYAISINDQWRICFRFEDGDAHDVEVCDYHSQENRMRVPNNRPMKRRPTHPGDMLGTDFLPEYSLTVATLAEAIGVSRQSINELLRGRRAVTPEMALRFARLFGNSPEFWLNAQRAVDLWDATQTLKREMARITPLQIA